MLENLFFTILFVIGIYYIFSYRLNVKKAADLTKDAIFPHHSHEYQQILIPAEWKEMKPLTKQQKAYQRVNWTTNIAIAYLVALLIIFYATDWLHSGFLNSIYWFLLMLNMIKHEGNFYLLSEGIILNGRYYDNQRIKYYEVEKIVRWHSLYGLNDRVNNSYKLTFAIKNNWFEPNFVVITDQDFLRQITDQLSERKIYEKEMDTGDSITAK
ncbi:hypothetical protein LS684_08730 [Cytobacillus spongiae]|uniref:hypothetical protein n=1 Tax=Cytobacillus spongiae TaxID=2901381 RepID=UPI001F1EAE0F|nr:hypothetical protein [Cytobacillus spongiae]UII57501.1 hypothetical protein LS684_08730 [Cytobacillus spongiae]